MSMGIRLFIGLESCRMEGIDQWKGIASGLLEPSLSTAVGLGGPLPSCSIQDYRA